MSRMDTDSNAPKKRRLRNPDLTRESIARAALEIVDREGSDALTFRRLSDSMGTAMMTLYNRVPNRDALVRDIVAILLSEIDTSSRPDEDWETTIRRVARSHRAMALAHPRAYTLVLNVPFDESPMLDHSISVLRLHNPQGVPFEERYRILSLVSSYVTGFLAMETQAILREERHDRAEGPFTTHTNPIADGISEIVRGDAFEHNFDVIIAGFKAVDTESFRSAVTGPIE